MFSKKNIQTVFAYFLLVSLSGILIGCSGSAGNKGSQEPVSAPVMVIDTTSASTYSEYSAALEGKVNVEIRPQVDGYLEEIFVDEGSYVSKGQSLFRINDLSYKQQLNNALGNQHAAEANLAAAEIELNKMNSLSKGNVVSDVQVKTAESGYKAALAVLEQAKAAVEIARINLGYTVIKAPVSGYVGRIPKRRGSLVGRTDLQALTVLSDVSEVYAYFSMSEVDFIHFNKENEGKSTKDKLSNLMPVSLILADENVYEYPGKIEMVDGQFDRNTGSITMRATFPNPDNFLRSGNTGKIKIQRLYHGIKKIPMASTIDMQGKIFVLSVDDSNKVSKKPIMVLAQTEQSYLVDESLSKGETIVLSGVDRLQERQLISPQVNNNNSTTKK